MVKYLFSTFSKGSEKTFSGNQDYLHIDRRRQYFIVADGMSGLPAGMQAAFYAVHGIRLQMPFLIRELLNSREQEEAIPNNLDLIITSTNEMMHSLSESYGPYRGWGTTLDLCLFFGKTAYIGHVGDGRVYYKPKSKGLVKLTDEHIVPINGAMDGPKDLLPFLTSLESYIGGKSINVQCLSHEMNVGDTILIATDGLFKTVPLNTISRILSASEEPREVTSALRQEIKKEPYLAESYASFSGKTIDEARKAMRDDVTFIIARRVL